MTFKLVKKLNEKCPEIIKILLAPILRKKLIANKVFIDTYRKLEEYDKLSKKDRDKLNFEKLKEILIYCYENIDYYRNKFETLKFNPQNIECYEDIKILPFTNKNIFLKNQQELLSKKDIDYYVAYTGGSSGKPLKIYLDKESIYKERAFVYHYWSRFGYNYKTDKMITFRGLEFEGRISKFNPIYNEIVLSPFKLNEANLNKYIKIINNFKAEFISGYPSIIKNFCKLLENSNRQIDINIKCVFFISENCSQEDNNYIKRILKCNTCIFYGHSERAVFGEKYEGNYEFNGIYGYTEFIPTDVEGEYRIACTGFLNYKMPFVRYLTDDIVKISNQKIIEIIGHNDSQVLIGKNNERISISSLNFHSNEFNKIIQYQFEQWEKGKVNLNLLLEKNLTNEELFNINKALSKKIKGVLDIKIKFVDEIILTKRGKVNLIIQHIKL